VWQRKRGRCPRTVSGRECVAVAVEELGESEEKRERKEK